MERESRMPGFDSMILALLTFCVPSVFAKVNRPFKGCSQDTRSFYFKDKARIHKFFTRTARNAKSTPQHLSSVEEIATDPIANAIPEIAWRVPDQIHFAFATLSLRTPERVTAAVKLLQRLAIGAIIESSLTTQAPISVIVEGAHVYLHTARSVTKAAEEPFHPRAPIVALQAFTTPLKESMDYPRRVESVACKRLEPRAFLYRTAAIVITLFEKRGLIPVTPAVFYQLCAQDCDHLDICGQISRTTRTLPKGKTFI